MKRGLMFALAILVVGCSSGGGSGSGGTPTPKPGPPQSELLWGDLACQKARSCSDPVLNKAWIDLQNFFKLNFERPQVKSAQDTHELLIYRCGIRTQKMWTQFFHESIGESAFFDVTLSWEPCTYAENLEEQMTNYFKNTEEYKNESK
jgi:hypothetical protein